MVTQSKRKRSVADQLSDLLSPTPTTDVDLESFEAFGAGSGPALVDSEEEDGEDGVHSASRAAGRAAPEKGLRMRGDISLHEAEYSGRATSRKKFVAESNDDREELDESDDNAEAPDESGDEDGNEGGFSILDMNPEEQQRREEEPESGDEAAMGELTSDQDKDDDLQREWEQLKQQEMRAVEGLRKKHLEDRAKGAAVVLQRDLWDRMVAARILMQGPMTASHRLPRPAAHAALREQAPELARAAEEAAAAARSTLCTLTQVFGALLANNPATEAEAEAEGSQEDFKSATAENVASGAPLHLWWNALDRLHQAAMPFCQRACDTWQRKSLAAGGGMGSGKLHALNQSISMQVQTAMRNTSRQVHRSRLPAHAVPRRLGEVAVPSTSCGAPDAGEEGEETRDTETYDDSEFYTQLLKEFVDSGSGAVAGADGNHESRTRRRKLVDRRASKGRKIRYEIQDKLVNFMDPLRTPLPPVAKQLISAKLFGNDVQL